MTAAVASKPCVAAHAKILVVDDVPVCREMVAAALRSNGYEVFVAPDGPAALEFLAQHDVQMIILDQKMPHVTGVEFLDLLRHSEHWHHIRVLMLCDAAEKDVVFQARALGVDGYMLKAHFSASELLRRVQTTLAGPTSWKRAGKHQRRGRSSAAPDAAQPAAQPQPASAAAPSASPAKNAAPSLIPCDAVLDAVADLAALKTFPGVIADLTAKTAAPHATQDLIATLKQDPIVALRVLHAANTAPNVNPRPRLRCLDDALKIIGNDGLRTIAQSLKPIESVAGDPPGALDLLRCWQHALATAAVMTRIVPKNDAVAAGLPHLIGLAHNLLEIILRQRFAKEFAAALDFAAQKDCPATWLFHQLFGISHAELLGEMMERLKLPQAIFSPIQQFAIGEQSPAGAAVGSTLARALSIAHAFAGALQLAPSLHCAVSPVAQVDCSTTLIPGDAIKGAEVRSEVITATAALTKLPEDQEKKLLEPLVPQRTARIWYVRHSAFVPLDPLEAALNLMCRLETHEQMPRTEEITDLAALIVAAPAADTPGASLAEANRVRRQSGRTLPILCLIPGDGKPPDQETAHFPLTLARLAKFVAQLKTPEK